MDDVSTVDHPDITDIQVESGRDRASVLSVTMVPLGLGMIGTGEVLRTRTRHLQMMSWNAVLLNRLCYSRAAS